LIGQSDAQCFGATIDSRECSSGNVFFALQGEQVDGHAFVRNAEQSGCSAVVVEREVEVDIPQIIVRNVRESLFDIAMMRRSELPARSVIAITGSVGKTTTKDMVAALLGENVVASKKSFNNDLGVPLTVLAAENAEYLVAEVGANDVGEIEPLASLVKPDIALLTSIDCAHLEGFGNKETVLREKVKLLQALSSDGIAIVPESIELEGFSIQGRTCTIGTSKNADVQIKTGIDAMGFATLAIGGADEVTLRVLGEHNAWNAAFAVVAAHFATGLCFSVLMALVAKVESPHGRLRRIEVCGITFYDDSYNANPASMRSALDFFSSLELKRKILVLGDMLELGESSHAEHRLMTVFIEKVQPDVVILVGQCMKVVSESIPSVHEMVASELAMKRIASFLQEGDSVLIKGSRGMALDRIIELKQQTKVSST
jgi:UDP-N-acetylmuramoyl-tripeptide--D-alanyl-D-alanine ligase